MVRNILLRYLLIIQAGLTLFQYNFIGSGSGSESIDISAYIDSTTLR